MAGQALLVLAIISTTSAGKERDDEEDQDAVGEHDEVEDFVGGCPCRRKIYDDKMGPRGLSDSKIVSNKPRVGESV